VKLGDRRGLRWRRGRGSSPRCRMSAGRRGGRAGGRLPEVLPSASTSPPEPDAKPTTPTRGTSGRRSLRRRRCQRPPPLSPPCPQPLLTLRLLQAAPFVPSLLTRISSSTWSASGRCSARQGGRRPPGRVEVGTAACGGVRG
jgi:hypothetical protein